MNASKRIQWLHKRIADMRYPNASRLAERFGISHRQAQRDVDYLRHNLGAPLAYHHEQRGFYYTAEFSLPTYILSANETDYVDTVTGTENAAKQEILQLQIPYTATLRIPDKLTRLELQRFILREERRGEFVCEFHSVELFLGVLFATEADITVLSPDWLRERMLRSAQRIIRNNKEENEA